ncbi:MAG: hypothetical protein CL859_10685 [Cyanobium sp. ARS6]|nr:hypothetical protein [Cyanobium sp. ARS6]
MLRADPSAFDFTQATCCSLRLLCTAAKIERFQYLRRLWAAPETQVVVDLVSLPCCFHHQLLGRMFS